MHWYDRIYDACKYSNGYSAPEALYVPGKITSLGCELQHKTFSYVDHRSGRPVRLYGTVDRYTSGADADLIVSEIIGDLLPFDRTTDHILNNDPNDRQIYCLLEEVLRKIYKFDHNSNNTSTRSFHGSESRGSPGSSGSKPETNGILQNLSYGNNVRSNNEINMLQSGPLDPLVTETIAEKLSVMEFLDFYKDIIQRVDEAANAEEKKNTDSSEVNQANLLSPPVNHSNERISQSSLQQRLSTDYQILAEDPYPYFQVDSYDSNTCDESSPYLSKKKYNMVNRKLITRNTTLPTISEAAEKWWSEEGEYLTNYDQQLDLNFPDNTVIPHSIPSPFQPVSMTSPIEVARSSDEEEFLREIEKTAIDLGFAEENGETTSSGSEDKTSSSSFSNSNYAYTAATIVFIYGHKMFVGSIGDSRVILLRQKCHYLDVMYLNEPPLAWYPIAAAKNSYFKTKRHILFQEPIVRGGFLVNEKSVFLLMFNDGVISNMLKINDYHQTSSDINRVAVQMVIKILEKCPPEDIAQKFIAHIKHSYSRKYKEDTEIGDLRREGMSFLFADLRQITPRKPEYDDLLSLYQPKPNIPESALVQSYPKMLGYSYPLKSDETTNQFSTMDKVYDLFQEMFDREESRRPVNNVPPISEDTWVFLRSDQNET